MNYKRYMTHHFHDRLDTSRNSRIEGIVRYSFYGLWLGRLGTFCPWFGQPQQRKHFNCGSLDNFLALVQTCKPRWHTLGR
jgi:hypothetical protein